MRLERLEVVNWGPYRGSQVMDLSTDPSAPVILVYGENMRGKTSLLRAIRWVLYGKVAGHDGSLIPANDFANYDAREEASPFEFGVRLDYSHRGKRVTLSRMAEGCGRRTTAGWTVDVSSTRAHLLPQGGQPVPERDIDEFIHRTLHPDIADFFLFDGEMLARFEERLRGPSSAAFVRQQIEMALGIPALRQARVDVTYLQEQASAAVRRAAKAEQSSLALSGEIETLEDRLRRLAKDRAELDAAAREAASLVGIYDAALREVDNIREVYFARNAAIRAEAEYRRDWEGRFEDLRRRLDKEWWIPLATRLAQRWGEAKEKLDAQLALQRERALLEQRVRMLHEQAETSFCSACRQAMPREKLDASRQRLAEAEQELASLAQPEDILGPSEVVRRLARFDTAHDTVEAIRADERDVMRIGLRAEAERTKIATLTEQIEGNDVDIAALEKSRQEAAVSEREARMHIETIDREIEVAKRRQAEITRQLAKASPTSAPLKAEMDVLDSLGQTIEDALGRFRETTRKRVQAEASRIFTTLTTEPDYAGLRVDGNYYLSIVDSTDRVIARRSAGADQLVTMSLIGALARCSVEEGPVVMDTPFGRLDLGHRRRVLEWVSAIENQAVLFVQSGEFVRSSDLGHLRGRVGREYVLARTGASSTRIEGIDVDY